MQFLIVVVDSNESLFDAIFYSTFLVLEFVCYSLCLSDQGARRPPRSILGSFPTRQLIHKGNPLEEVEEHEGSLLEVAHWQKFWHKCRHLAFC